MKLSKEEGSADRFNLTDSPYLKWIKKLRKINASFALMISKRRTRPELKAATISFVLTASNPGQPNRKIPALYARRSSIE